METTTWNDCGNTSLVNLTSFGNSSSVCPVTTEAPKVVYVPPGTGLNWTYIMNHEIYTTVALITQNRYYVLLPFSVLGNLLCAAIFFPQIRSNNGGTYFIMGNVAVWDMLTVVIMALNYLLAYYHVHLGVFGCKLISFLVAFCPLVAVWLVVLMVMDRLMVISSPFRYKRFCGLRTTVLIYVGLIAVMALFEIQEFITLTSGVIPGNGPPRYSCQVKPEYQMFYNKIWTPVFYSVLTVIPVILVIILNTALVIKIKRKLGRMTQSTSRSTDAKETHISILALVVSAVFVICNLPACVLFLMRSAGWAYRTSEAMFLRYLILHSMAFTLKILNHCVNVFLYFLSGRKFREDAKRLLFRGLLAGGVGEGRLNMSNQLPKNSMTSSFSKATESTKMRETDINCTSRL